jgi:Flp pilus assembly protein TadG
MLLKFLRDPRGAILPIFALALLPLVVSTGAVIDYTNAYDQRSLVQNAMDAAALAAGKQVGLMSTDEIKVEAENFFLANVGTDKITNVPTLSTDVDGATVDVETELHVPTYFLGIIGLDEFVFDLHAQVTVAMGTIEVAMVLDNSTSMCQSCTAAQQNSPTTKIGTLKSAATTLATTLYGLGATSTKVDPVKIALIPFGASVNVGPSVTWVDKTGKATYAGDAQKYGGASSTLNPYGYFGTLKDSSGNAISWGGCVQERPIPYDVSDDPPSTASSPTAEQAKTLFLPMFAPDEPDNWTCSSSGSGQTLTSSCALAGSGSSARRYSGTPTGSQSYNNYLPDAGVTATCGSTYNTVTMTSATPAVFTKTAHGLTIGTGIVFNTTSRLYTGVVPGDTYYAVPATSSTFWLTSSSTGTTVTVGNGTSNTFTVTKASPAVFTKSSHGLAAGTAIKPSTTGALYTGLTSGSTYYVISTGLSANDFRVSSTSGTSGTAVNTSGSQSGTHSYVSEALFTASSHGLAVGDAVIFTTTGALPTNISASTVYYVRTVPSTSTFTVATTSGGSPIYPGTTQSGTHKFYKLIATSGSQSGTHTYFVDTLADNLTCNSGNANCGGSGKGKSELVGLGGVNIAGSPQCKYGTSANKGTVASITIGGFPGGPNYMCTTNAITPLTATSSTITSAIAAQSANGYTNITAGIMWGLRTLSPGIPFTEGRAYEDTENKKIMIVMTDGANTYNVNSEAMRSFASAWGYVQMNHLGLTSAELSTSNNNTLEGYVVGKMEDRMEAACQAADAANIDVYTVAFQVTDTDTLQLLEDCASDPTMAYQSNSNTELLAAFSAIGDQISLLRLAQ